MPSVISQMAYGNKTQSTETTVFIKYFLRDFCLSLIKHKTSAHKTETAANVIALSLRVTAKAAETKNETVLKRELKGFFTAI